MGSPKGSFHGRTDAGGPHLSIVIPCFNEAQNVSLIAQQLFPVVEEFLPQQMVQVILVDDGSTDDTLDRLNALAAQHPCVQVVSHGENRGLGAAIRTGFSCVQGDVVVTTDSDGTYPFSEIRRILQLLAPEVDLVVASPYHAHGNVEGVAPYRRVLSQGASLIYRLLLDRRIHTYTALFRAYRREVIEHVPSTADGFLMPAEFLANAILMGYRVAEFPTALHVRCHGQSKARVVRIILAHLRFQARLIWRRLTGERAKA
jgi:dolichol-phosphate mannosyltransferase